MKEKLFNRFKKIDPENKRIMKTKTQDVPLAEYKETLYTSDTKSKKQAYAFSNQIIWRDIQKIEKNVDMIHITSAKKPSNELDKVIDRLIAKKKK